MRTIFSILYVIVVLILSLLLSKCNLSYPTDFVSDPIYTPECKIAVIQGYYTQKSVDKSALVPLSQSCKESNRFTRCEKHIADRTLFAECKELLK